METAADIARLDVRNEKDFSKSEGKLLLSELGLRAKTNVISQIDRDVDYFCIHYNTALLQSDEVGNQG